MSQREKSKIIRLTPKKLQTINPKKQELTVEILRQFPGMDSLSDQEATKIITSINTLSSILYELSKKMPGIGTIIVDNQQVIENNNNLAA